ncbi:hypothetical protein [Umezawaea sp.]|uniref:hypothetical protein n=1 Tax=Umezawaea sp. TaxID=1955258 RepID=UPI002ED5E874
MAGLEDRMIDLVWHVVVTCGRRRPAEATARRILREHFTPADSGDVHGRAVRGRLVHALRAEFGAPAEAAVDRARVRDELAILRSRGLPGFGGR